MTKVTKRLFIGILLSPDLSYQLDKSIRWKKHRLSEKKENGVLQKIDFQQKEYLGLYFEDDIISWDELMLSSSLVRTTLESFFPDVRPEKLNVILLNQLLIS